MLASTLAHQSMREVQYPLVMSSVWSHSEFLHKINFFHRTFKGTRHSEHVPAWPVNRSSSYTITSEKTCFIKLLTCASSFQGWWTQITIQHEDGRILDVFWKPKNPLSCQMLILLSWFQTAHVTPPKSSSFLLSNTINLLNIASGWSCTHGNPL
jgi:hypothetical protein